MNSVIDRSIIAQMVVILAACIGAWFVFVEPRIVEAQRLDEEIRHGSQYAATIDQSMVQQLAQRLDEVRSRVREIEQRGEITRDSSHLYSVFMNLAREHDVTIGSLNPGNPEAARPGRRSSRSTAGSTVEDDQLTVYREIVVSLSGSYQSVAAFISALQSLNGYIEVQYLSMSSASAESGTVNARLTCRSIRFVLPTKLREMLGSPAADDSQGSETALDAVHEAAGDRSNQADGGLTDA